LDAPNISETARARKLELKTPLSKGKVIALGTKIFLPGGAWPPNVNFGPRNISETTRDRKLKRPIN